MNENINNLKNNKINELLSDLELSKNNLSINQIFKKIHHVINYANGINVPITPRLLSELAVAGFNFRTVKSVNDEKVYLYQDGIYNPNLKFIDDLIDRIYPDFKESQLRDVIRHIRTSSKVIDIKDINKDSALVPCQNLIYDRSSGKTKTFNPDYFIQSKIATRYPTGQELSVIKGTQAKNIIHGSGEQESQFLNMTVPEFVNDFFDKISDHNQGTRQQLGQELLDALEPNLNRGKCIINHGRGGCGKSSFTKLLLNIVGDGNYSSVDINELDDSNNIATMLGKTVNVGDDLSDKAKLFNNSAFKKITTNANITINQKYQTPYSTTLSLSLIQNENHFIKITGASGSLLSRRLLFIPFSHHFSEDEQTYIPYDDLKTLLSSKPVREYVLYQVLHQKRFKQYTVTHESKQLLNKFLYQNNPVKVFYQEFNDYQVTQIPRQLLYNVWNDFAQDNGFNGLNRTNFYNRFDAISDAYSRKRVRFTNHNQIDKIREFMNGMNHHPVDDDIPEINHSYRCYVQKLNENEI